MSEKEKVFDTNDIISCFKMSVDVNGIKRIEEYINKLEQENKQLKLDYELYKDNCVYRNYEVEKKDITIKQLKEVIEEVRDMLDLIIPELWNISNAMTYKVKAVRRALDKAKGE